MEIQQHDGVVVEVAGSRQGFAKHQRDGEVLQGRREAPKAVVLLPSLPPLYRPLGGGRRPGTHLHGGAAKGKGGWLPPKPSGAPPTPRVSNPRRRGRPKGGAPAHEGLVPFPLQPMGPSGIGGPTRWTPGTLPVISVQYR